MKVVILCGGKGTRLTEHTQSVPKPLIEIGGRPILWHIMKIYSAHGFNDFILCLGHRSFAIKEYFMHYLSWRHHDFVLDLRSGESNIHRDNTEREEWRITFVDTGEATNTGGRIKRVERLLSGEDCFMVTYGDGVADINIGALVDFHRRHRRVGTITVVRPLSQFGLVEVEDGDRVRRFREKPPLEAWVNGGFFVFGREVFDHLGADDVLEQMPFEEMASRGELMAYRHDGYWRCMDTYKDTLELNEAWASGKAPWKIW